MREIFLSLGVLYLLAQLGWSGWWDIPLVLTGLVFDYYLALANKKSAAEAEALKIFLQRLGRTAGK